MAHIGNLGSGPNIGVTFSSIRNSVLADFWAFQAELLRLCDASQEFDEVGDAA